MLARCYSLKEKEDFARVEGQGQVVQSDSFGLAYFERGDADPPRFGFIVSTKVSKESVQRNRIKRAMAEAVRYSLTDLKKGFDVVFLAKQRSAKTDTSKIMPEVKEALKKANLLK
jgi:ribonuclease P protein component